MEGSIDQGLSGGADGDRVVDLANHRLVGTDLEQGARAEPAPASLEVRRVDHMLGAVLTLRGELDLATVSLLGEELDRATRGTGAVVIDLSGLRFIDSSGLHVLVGAERELGASGGQLVLVRGPRAVRRVFELTGLDTHFEWCDSPSAGLRAALERRIASQRVPEPGADRHTPAEGDRELGGAMWS